MSGAVIIYSPAHNCFKSSHPIGGYFAESFTGVRELKALIRLFGGYGFDKFDRMIKEHTAALLNCIDTALRSNHEALEAIAVSLDSGDRVEREANVKQILDMETLLGFCIQAGQAIAFRKILVEAAGVVLTENLPLIDSLLSGVATHLPDEIFEKDEIRRLRQVVNNVRAGGDHDTEWMYSVMREASIANDRSWSLLPYLCAAFMVSSIWNTTAYDISTGGFSNNLQCLARCINTVIAGSECVRLERAEQQKHSISNGHAGENLEPEIPSRVSVRANIKSAMQLLVRCSSAIVLDSWKDSGRSYIVPKLTFLNQLCENSPYLPRSTLEIHIPYAILRSVYRQYYGSSHSLTAEFVAQSQRRSPLISLAHTSPATRLNHGDLENSGIPFQYEQTAYGQDTQLNHANPAWNGHVVEQQQELYGISEEGGSLPPPPWETQSAPCSELVVSQVQLTHGGHPGAGMYPQPMPDMDQALVQSSMFPTTVLCKGGAGAVTAV